MLSTTNSIISDVHYSVRNLRMILLNLGMIILNLGINGCAGVQRPDANVCGVNAKSSTLRCYNIKSDYNDDGSRKADAKPSVKPIESLMTLNGGIFFSPTDVEKLKVFLQDWRDYAKEHCQ